MVSTLSVGDVFVPGLVPRYTYNPRSEENLETQLRDYLAEKGAVLTVAGPTKTGKSVLLKRVVETPVWVDGASIDSIDDLWQAIVDEHSAYTGVAVATGSESTAEGKANASGGIPTVIRVGAEASHSSTDSRSWSYSTTRSTSAVARGALIESQRPLVIDDFHFIERTAQKDIVKGIKPLVLEGVPIIFVSISHRIRDVVTSVPDMRGRTVPLEVRIWSQSELEFIASEGFKTLDVFDPGGRLAARLAEEAYGSPHLMQMFCRELCKANGVRGTQNVRLTLQEPGSWSKFFSSMLDDSARQWFERLLGGPAERGQKRAQFKIKGNGELDGYGLTLLAIAKTGPKLQISKDEIREQVAFLVEGVGPATDKTTRVLNYLSRIAATSITTPAASEEELDGLSDTDAQPVLEYVDDQPNSRLHLADPSFAFFLKWGAEAEMQ